MGRCPRILDASKLQSLSKGFTWGPVRISLFRVQFGPVLYRSINVVVEVLSRIEEEDGRYACDVSKFGNTRSFWDVIIQIAAMPRKGIAVSQTSRNAAA